MQFQGWLNFKLENCETVSTGLRRTDYTVLFLSLLAYLFSINSLSIENASSITSMGGKMTDLK
jgi:hypothetical protein